MPKEASHNLVFALRSRAGHFRTQPAQHFASLVRISSAPTMRWSWALSCLPLSGSCRVLLVEGELAPRTLDDHLVGLSDRRPSALPSAGKLRHSCAPGVRFDRWTP